MLSQQMKIPKELKLSHSYNRGIAGLYGRLIDRDPSELPPHIFSGKPCKNGHEHNGRNLRFTNGGGCYLCNRNATSRNRVKKHKDNNKAIAVDRLKSDWELEKLLSDDYDSY